MALPYPYGDVLILLLFFSQVNAVFRNADRHWFSLSPNQSWLTSFLAGLGVLILVDRQP
ncbi:MAG: hypothetical protein HC881_13315 [Leptolyngbyaceae cyanobacterium SL_7_1]|nr:hypothetical protein [Leptolyngbyaceae cyanobacterium SL_7_1]